MYKVFFNTKLLLPGLEVPSLPNARGMCLPALPAKDELINLLIDFTQSDSTEWLQFGLESGPQKAWESLKEALPLETAAGGFVVGDKQFLLLIRRYDHWDLPKGKPEKGESLLQAALREVSEETGVKDLTLKEHLGLSYHIFFRDGYLHLKQSHWYIMETDTLSELTPQTEEAITQARWVNIDAFKRLKSGLYASLSDITEAGWLWIKKHRNA